MATLADLMAFLSPQDQLALQGSATVTRPTGTQSTVVAQQPTAAQVAAALPIFQGGPAMGTVVSQPVLQQATTQAVPTTQNVVDPIAASRSNQIPDYTVPIIPGTAQQGGGAPTTTGGGGGGTTTTPKQETTTTGPGGTTAPGGGTQTGGSLDLGGLTADELRAMLNYLSAQTGLSFAQLSQQAGAIGDAVRQLMDQISRQSVIDMRNTENDALRRGIFHSGILARNVGQVQSGVASQRNAARSDAANKLSDLQNQMDSLVAQNTLQAASAGSQILQANLPAGEQAALQNQLAQLNLGAIPNIDLSSIANRAAGQSIVGTGTNLGGSVTSGTPTPTGAAVQSVNPSQNNNLQSFLHQYQTQGIA